MLKEETDASVPAERLLQKLWQHQRLRRDQLRTLDGKRLRVLHPGFWNQEAGPDFHNAVLQFDLEKPRSGDVEIDLHSQGWRAHGHDRNPAYENVILHVVWDGKSETASLLPSLPLKPYLDAPVAELMLSLDQEPSKQMPDPLHGQCSGPLRDVSQAIWTELLGQAARVRLQQKAAQFEARARQAGWEQALWEGLLGALGYKHNVWPMRRVAELLPVLQLEQSGTGDSIHAWQARLLGVSNLLPADLTRTRKQMDEYIRGIWDRWWRERDQFAEILLPRALWRFNGLRPANHPQRRLALAAHWLANDGLVDRLLQWFSRPVPESALLDSLLEILQVEQDGFWSWHWTFRSARMARPQPLLGPQRATDLAVNVVLPWFWMRAGAGKNAELQSITEHRYFAWPPSEDNSVLRLARQRLLGGLNARALRTAAAQQGLLQIVRDFCDHSNAVCDRCPFPDLVRALPREPH